MTWTRDQETLLRDLCRQYWPRGNWSDGLWTLFMERLTHYPPWAAEAAARDLRLYQTGTSTPGPGDLAAKASEIYGLFMKQKRKKAEEAPVAVMTPQEFAQDAEFWEPRVNHKDKGLAKWYQSARMLMLEGGVPLATIREPGSDEPEDDDGDSGIDSQAVEDAARLSPRGDGDSRPLPRQGGIRGILDQGRDSGLDPHQLRGGLHDKGGSRSTLQAGSGACRGPSAADGSAEAVAGSGRDNREGRENRPSLWSLVRDRPQPSS